MFGNLTRDGRWAYAWDAENRLMAMETRSDVATALGETFPRLRLTFAYDASGRRLAKQVQGWQYGASPQWVTLTATGSYNSGTVGGTITLPGSAGLSQFVYDGWNLAAEINATTATPSVAATYVWGLDVSQSFQGAGGVGGLFCAFPAGSTGPCAPAYDSNANVVAWVALNSGAVVGTREHGPFGELLGVTGLAATALPIGWSTKYVDRETGLVYYGFRYYHADQGRWPNRDPIGERGGLNLYNITRNNPVTNVDYLGLDDIRIKNGTTNVVQYMPEGFMGRDLTDKAVDLGILRGDLVILSPELASKLGVDAIEYNDLIKFGYEDTYAELIKKLRDFTSYGLSKITCSCSEINLLIKKLIVTSAKLEVIAYNPGKYKNLGEVLDQFNDIGTRGLISGNISEYAKSLPGKQADLYRTFEQNDKFNSLPGAKDHPGPANAGYFTPENIPIWTRAEAQRLDLIAKTLKREARTRGCN
jgi:RHS repeat-associated protein